MRSFGYLEGRDFGFEARYADGDTTRLFPLAADLVRLKPDVIVAGPTIAVLALRKATATIPIVGVNLTNAVGSGLILSETRSGTNVTGSLIHLEGNADELLEVARSLEPSVSAASIFVDVGNPLSVKRREAAVAATTKFGLQLVPVEVQTAEDIGRAFQALQRAHVKVVIVGPDCLYLTMRQQIAAYALASKILTINYFREAVEAGGALAYGIDLHASYARAAHFAIEILNGQKPSDLPVDRPPKSKLWINQTTVQAIGLTIPATLLSRAAEVVE
jgi:putative ABC transport system substrate-binding protein